MDIDTAIMGNRGRNIREVTNEFNVSIGTVHNIVTNILKYRKVCCQWVPHLLSEHRKEQRINLSLLHLLRYRDDAGDFLLHILAGDETWCHHFELEGKFVSVHNGNIPIHLGQKNSQLSSQPES
ncbi:mariner Mos1 transposase [Trichonephila clavipes]|nr:mariner Mos1 transposase [Trichonephila clavipes]